LSLPGHEPPPFSTEPMWCVRTWAGHLREEVRDGLLDRRVERDLALHRRPPHERRPAFATGAPRRAGATFAARGAFAGAAFAASAAHPGRGGGRRPFRVVSAGRRPAEDQARQEEPCALFL
jgi:hypothetical protein